MIKLSITAPSMAFTYEKKHLKKVMRAAGAEVAAAARSLIGRGTGGRTYYHDGRRVTASAPGKAPGSVSGQLRRGIKVRLFRSGDGVAIRDTQFYALILEAGAKGGGRKGGHRGVRKSRGQSGTARVMAPRPFLTAALGQKQASVAARIQEALAAGIAFRKMKK